MPRKTDPSASQRRVGGARAGEYFPRRGQPHHEHQARPATRQDAVINREDVADTLLYLAERTPKKPQVFELFNGDKSIDNLLSD